MRFSRFAAILFGIIFGSNANGEYIAAPWQNSNWETKQTKTLCRLQQSIEGFGSAEFLQQAGNPLQFFLQPAVYQPNVSNASLFVEPAPWHDDLTYRKDYRVYIEDLDSCHQNRLIVFDDVAETMLNALYKGQYPVFSFIQQATETRVAISAINFSVPYLKFIDCRQALLPFSRNQLEHGSLFFLPQTTTLSSHIENRLQQIANYLNEMNTVNGVVVNETATVGESGDHLFKARAKRIIGRLVELGVAADRLRIKTTPNYQPDQHDIVLKVFGPEVLSVFYYRKENTALNHREKLRLDWLARYIKDYFQAGQVVINSYTDSKGPKEKNLTISRERGNVIKDYLVAQGVAPERLLVKAYGESHPVKSNRYPAGRALNRRIVIEFNNQN